MNPSFENEIEKVFLQNMANNKKDLQGKTIILVDVSGSMNTHDGRSCFTRLDYACALSIIAREISDNIRVFTFSNEVVEVANRRGFALRDVIDKSQKHGGTELGSALRYINSKENYDRIVIITDEQSSDNICNSINKKSYIINVSNNKNGIGYKQGYTHINGFSDSVFDYIKEIEKTLDN